MEIWRDIEGYEGLYQVSSKGNVRSLERRVAQKNKFGTTSVHTYKSKLIKPIPMMKGRWVNYNKHKNYIWKYG